eukprot:scaffold90497_cov18-Tisochrysis_lutea.AAC.1
MHARGSCTSVGHERQGIMYARGSCMPGDHACQLVMYARGSCTPGGHVRQVAMHARWPCIPGVHACQGVMNARWPCMPASPKVIRVVCVAVCNQAGIDAEEEEADDEDQPAGPDPEDGWMLELSEKQLLKLLAQVGQTSAACTGEVADKCCSRQLGREVEGSSETYRHMRRLRLERHSMSARASTGGGMRPVCAGSRFCRIGHFHDEARCAAKEAAAAAAGVNPYADESTSPDGSISAPVGAQRALAEASTSKGATQESVTLAASSSEGVQGEE